jgi:hypothetical protein
MATLLLKAGFIAAVLLASAAPIRPADAQMTGGELTNRAQMRMADDLAKRDLRVTACAFYYTVGTKGVKEARDKYELIVQSLDPEQQEKCLKGAREVLAKAP